MMKKRLQQVLSCMLLCAVLASGLCLPASAAFRDVPKGHWAAESIQRCTDLGFFQGESAARFGLGHKMTRAAFAVVLCRFFGWEVSAPTVSVYQDVSKDAWYAGAVETAYNHGALTDQREDFRPADFVTRSELAVMLVRALGYGSIAGLAQDLKSPFTDVSTSAGYITMAHDLGLFNGTSATAFSPDVTASREQVAVILMRLYDRLYTPVPEQSAIVSAPSDLTGLEVVAIPAGRLFSQSLNQSMAPETAAAIRDDAHTHGAKALLHITAGSSAFSGNLPQAVTLLTEAVRSGGYDGLFLDAPQLSEKNILNLNNLVTALNAQLNDKLLYVGVDAPAFTSTAHENYDYATLGAQADRLVIHVPTVEDHIGSTYTAPVDPLEEIYYAMRTLRKQIPAEKLTLMVTTTPMTGNEKGNLFLSDQKFSQLLDAKGTQKHYSDRYACAYVTGSLDGAPVTAWYLNGQSAETRSQTAQLLGIQQLCLSSWNAASAELREALI